MATRVTTTLADLREAADLTLADVARSVGTDPAAILRWERMEREPHPRFRSAYAKALGISVGRLGALIYANRQGD